MKGTCGVILTIHTFFKTKNKNGTGTITTAKNEVFIALQLLFSGVGLTFGGGEYKA